MAKLQLMFIFQSPKPSTLNLVNIHFPQNKSSITASCNRTRSNYCLKSLFQLPLDHPDLEHITNATNCSKSFHWHHTLTQLKFHYLPSNLYFNMIQNTQEIKRTLLTRRNRTKYANFEEDSLSSYVQHKNRKTNNSTLLVSVRCLEAGERKRAWDSSLKICMFCPVSSD